MKPQALILTPHQVLVQAFTYISNFSIVRNVDISTIYHKSLFVLDWRTGAAQLILSPFLQGRVGFNSFTNPLAAGSEAGNLSRFNTANLSRINQVIDDERMARLHLNP